MSDHLSPEDMHDLLKRAWAKNEAAYIVPCEPWKTDRLAFMATEQAIDRLYQTGCSKSTFLKALREHHAVWRRAAVAAIRAVRIVTDYGECWVSSIPIETDLPVFTKEEIAALRGQPTTMLKAVFATKVAFRGSEVQKAP